MLYLRTLTTTPGEMTEDRSTTTCDNSFIVVNASCPRYSGTQASAMTVFTLLSKRQLSDNNFVPEDIAIEEV